MVRRDEIGIKDVAPSVVKTADGAVCSVGALGRVIALRSASLNRCRMQLDQDESIIRRVLWRLIPFCMLCYVFNYIDRVNISMAQLAMQDKTVGVPGFTKEVFGIGAAVFFLGYFIFELPSNLIMQRVGARWWIARIMITWGMVSMGMAFIKGPWSFYCLRFLLGLAEAGFFPGVLLYISYWLPQRYHARTAAIFLTSTAMSGLIGNPLGGGIMALVTQYPVKIGTWQPQPWQWLFLMEAVPSVLLGLFTLLVLTDRPAGAKWLSSEEQERLSEMLAEERRDHPATHMSDLRHAFSSMHTWVLSVIYGLNIFSFYTLNFFTPSIIKNALINAGTLVTETASHPASPKTAEYLWVGLLSAIPFGSAIVAMVLIGRHSDKAEERKLHLAFACALIVIGMGGAGLAAHFLQGTAGTVLTIAGLSVGAAGAFGVFGPFWALPARFLTGTALAAGFAIINSIGNLFGGFGQMFLGSMKSSEGLLIGAGFGLMGMVLVLLAPLDRPVPARGFEVVMK